MISVKSIKDGLSYDDVLLVPQFSDIESRSGLDVSVEMGQSTYSHPIIPANMKTVMGLEMIESTIKSGGLALMHRFMPLNEQVDLTLEIIKSHGNKNFGVSVGVKEKDATAIEKFLEIGVNIFCIDIAHGDSSHCLEMVKFIKYNKSSAFVIAGNVATGAGAERLWRAGADAVKSGVGGGSCCLTRINSGNGVPQFTALVDVFKSKQKLKKTPSFSNRPLYIIADGGMKNAGDLVKGLCFADMAMIGNLFAGCDEAPGDRIIVDGLPYKEYVGSSTHKTDYIEGVSALVPISGSFNNVLTKLLEGLRSGMSYQNAHNLLELKDNPEFVRISSAGLKESYPHDVLVK